MQSGLNSEALQHAADLLEQADSLIIAAGAGMGVDSGLPDFRGNEGFWQAYPVLGRAGLNFYEIASPDTFHRDPRLAWGFYGHRLQLYRDTAPHKGFAILRRWADHTPHGANVFTSNVDGQFQNAGFDPDRVTEVHGSIHHLQCLRPCSDAIWSADGFTPQVDHEACSLTNDLPTCPNCGGLARPNILMFGDDGWIDHRQTDQFQRLQAWLAVVQRPVVIEIGAGIAVATVRHFSNQVVLSWGGRLIRINPTDAQMATQHDVGLATGALETLSAIDAKAFIPNLSGQPCG